jgi:hypothetical protein
MAAIACGDNDSAQAIALAIRRCAQESGYLIYSIEATHLLAAVGNPPPLNQIVGFACLQSHIKS